MQYRNSGNGGRYQIYVGQRFMLHRLKNFTNRIIILRQMMDLRCLIRYMGR